jgi:hypothetical protein
MGNAMTAFVILETVALVFIIINALASAGNVKKLESYQIVRMDIPDKDGNVLVRVRLMYRTKAFDLLISSASMRSSKWALGDYIELPV